MSQEIDIFISELENYFNNLKPSDLLSLDKYYANEAHFKDPFNDVTGCAHIKAIFEHMFQVLESPRFVVTERLFDAEKAFMCWYLSSKGALICLFVRTMKGSSKLACTGIIGIQRRKFMKKYQYWEVSSAGLGSSLVRR